MFLCDLNGNRVNRKEKEEKMGAEDKNENLV